MAGEKEEGRNPTVLVGIATVVLCFALLTMVGVGVAQDTADTESNQELEGLDEDGFEESVDIIARTGADERAEVEVGEAVALGFPKHLVEGEDASFSWSVNSSDAELLHTESSDEDIPPHNARVTSVRVTEPVDTLVELEVEINSDTHTYERELISVAPETRLGGELSQFELMQDYAPVLRFHEDELYKPTRYEALFENAELKRGGVDEQLEIIDLTLLDNANLYDLDVTERGVDDSVIESFEYILPRALTDEWGDWQSGYGASSPPERDSLTHIDPTGTDVYPPTVYTNIEEGVEFSPDESYLDEFDDVDSYDGGTYTAVGYWMVYIHDPKPLISIEEGLLSADRLAAHTGDQEPFYILFDEETGEPEWLLAQQHMGGEYRKWEHVEKEDGRPVIYPAEGAHSNFFGPEQGENRKVRTPSDGDREPRYIYQDQYVSDPGDTSRNTLSSLALNYLDPVAYEDTGTAWAHEDADIQQSTDERYELSVLTGDEAWSDYDGKVYTYPQPFEEVFLPSVSDTGATEGTIPQEVGVKFDDPGAWAEEDEGEEYDDGFRRLFPDIAQIDGEFSNEELAGITTDKLGDMQDDLIIPDIDCPERGVAGDPVLCVEAPPAIVLENDRVSPEDADGSVGVNVINTGMQPHEFTLSLDVGTGSADYSFYVNSIYPSNVAGAEVPLDPLRLDEGTYSLDADLSVYPDEYRLDELEPDQRKTLEITQVPPRLEIDEDAEIAPTPVERWNFSTDGRFHTDPVASDGTVYIGGSTFAPASVPKVYAIDADTGDTEWMSQMADADRPPQNIAVSGGTVAAEAPVGITDVIQGFDKDTGEKIWSRSVTDIQKLTGTDDRIYAISGGKVTTLNPRNGETDWEFSPDDADSSDPVSEPVVSGGTAYFIIDGHAYAVDIGTGADEDIGITGEFQSIAASAGNTYLEKGSQLLAYDPGMPGKTVPWRFPDDVLEEPFSGMSGPDPVASDDTVYISHEESLFSVDNQGGQGSLNWALNTDRRALELVVTDHTVYVQRGFGLDAVDSEKGETIWEFFGEGDIAGSPDASGSNLYVMSHSSIASLDQEYKIPGETLHAIGREADNLGGGIVRVNVSLTRAEQLEGDIDWSVYVDGERKTYPGMESPLVMNSGDEYHLIFAAPSQILDRRSLGRGYLNRSYSSPGTYDLTIKAESEDEVLSDTKQDLIRYTEPDHVPRVETPRLRERETLRRTFTVEENTPYLVLGAGTVTEQQDSMKTSSEEIREDVSTAQYQNRASSPEIGQERVYLYAPDGSLITPDSSGVEINATKEGIIYRVENPPSGEWGYEIYGGDQDADLRTVLSIPSPIDMNVENTGVRYYAGSSADLTATLFGDEPLTDAEVTAKIESPDEGSEEIQFDEKYPGVYTTTVPLDPNTTGNYTATVTALDDETGTELSEDTSWRADFVTPVSVEQTGTPNVERGREEQIRLSMNSEALLGLRSVEPIISDFSHTGDETATASAHIKQGPTLMEAGETPDLDASVKVPSDAPTGLYTAELLLSVDGTGTAVDEVRIRVTDDGCIDRRDAGRGEVDDICPRDREMDRGDEARRTERSQYEDRRSSGRGDGGTRNGGRVGR